MTFVPFPEFAPDLIDIPSSATDTAFNVYPSALNSYSPLKKFVPYSPALTAKCQGAFSVEDANGNVRVYAGDATKLYRLTSASTTFANVSRASGYTTSSFGVWRFASFGNRIIATNYTDVPQSYIEGTSTLFADLITNGVTDLRAKYVTVLRDFVVFANTSSGTDGAQPQRVHWTAINNPTSVPIPGSNEAALAQSDFQNIPGDHGEILGVVGDLAGGTGAVFLERSVYRMQEAGPPVVFNFQIADGARGLFAEGALVTSGGVAYYWGEDGFYAFDGGTSLPIGRQKIDRFVYNDLDAAYKHNIVSSSDPTKQLIYWAYPGAGNASGLPNRLLIYNKYLQRWSITEANAVQVESLFRSSTFAKTLEQLNAFGTLDSLGISLDSPVWQGGRTVLAGFDASHRFGYFDGDNMVAKIATGDIEPAPDRQSMVTKARPIIETDNATMCVASRDKPYSPIIYTAAKVLQPSGAVPLRQRGRYHRFCVDIAENATWENASGISIDSVQQLGSR